MKNMKLYIHEMKMNWKMLAIWTLCVGVVCAGCILLYNSLQDSLEEVAESYSNMGAMSAAIGLDKLSIATMTGFYATEIAMIHGLGGAMFAAMLGAGLIAKEEAGHTSEFLNVFPISRRTIVMQKYFALVSNVLIFNLVCVVLYAGSILTLGEEMPQKEFLLYHTMQFIMQLEIGTVCFFLSSLKGKVQTGGALGIAILLFAADMMCRIIPAIENLKYITPFYYANAADIFTSGEVLVQMLVIGVVILLLSGMGAVYIYERRDLAS